MRLMTIHRAKGLEFPVVCVADLGKDGREDDGAAADLRRRPRRPAAGLARRRRGRQRAARARSRQSRSEDDEEEERRIFYVARHARPGAPGAQRRHRPREARRSPSRWRSRCAGWRRAGCCPEAATCASRPELRGPASVRRALPPAPDRVARPPPGARAASERRRASPARAGAVPAPRALPVSRLSYSGLEAYSRCGYRFYLSARCGCRRVGAAARAPSRCPRRRLARRCCAARSCTSCSSSSTSRARPCPAATRSRR